MITRRLFGRVLPFVFAFLAVIAWGNVSRADDVADEADLQFQLGAERYEQGDFKGALERFLASNRLVPNRNVLFNIARTYEQLKRTPDAYRYYVQALDGETNPVAKKRVEDALARIGPFVAVLRIETDPPGATIFLDRKDLGPRGTTPRLMGQPEGRKKIFVEKPGYEPAESAVIELKNGQETKVVLKLKQILGGVRFDGEVGIKIKMDDEQNPVLCTIPCNTQIAPGRHTFFFVREGYQTSEVTTDIPPNETTPVRARLTAQSGALVVSSDVRDALISVDGTAMGFTPAVLNVPVGKHQVRIAQQGYKTYVEDVEISMKRETKVEGQLSFVEEVSAASRVTESVDDAPASVTIISSQELRAMGYPTIAEALRGVRGLYLSDDRSYVTVGFRGYSRPGDYGNRVLVLLDGQPMNDNYIWSSYVGTDGRVDIDDIDRIEVVRGPGSVLYGSSAFFGVINLVTRPRGGATHGEASVGTFGDGIGKGRATAVVRLSPDAGFWMTVSGLQGAGRDTFFPEYRSNPTDPAATKDASGLPSDGNARGNDRQWAGMFTGRFWYKAFTVQWFLQSRRKYLPTAEYDTIFNDQRQRFGDTRGMVEARFEPQLTKELQSLTRAHLNLYDFDGLSPYSPADGGPGHDTYRGRWGGVEQRFVFSPNEKLRLTAGGEIIEHFVTRQTGVNDAGAYLLNDKGQAGRNDPFTVGAGYLNADIAPVKAFKVVAGARLDYYDNLPKFELFPAFNPRLALIIKPYEGGNLKIMGAKAFRAPSVYELHYTSSTQVSPTSLSPEQIYSGEVEFTQRLSQAVSATIAGYSNYVKDLVVLNDIGGGITQYSNSKADVLILGTEFEVRREWRQGWMLGATYTYQKASYQGGTGLRDVPNSIEHLGSLKGAVPILGRTLMAMSRVSIEGPRPDRNDAAGTPPQETTPVGVVWDFVLSGEVERMGVRYALGIYNAMDWRYTSVPSGEFRQSQIIQAGRTVLANVTVSF